VAAKKAKPFELVPPAQQKLVEQPKQMRPLSSYGAKVVV